MDSPGASGTETTVRAGIRSGGGHPADNDRAPGVAAGGGPVAGGVVGVMLGLTHVILNFFALILWLVAPLRVVPLRIAKGIGQFMASNRHSALLLLGYALSLFIVIPLIVIFVL